MKTVPNTALKSPQVGIRAGDLDPRGQKERILHQLSPLSRWHSETFWDISAIHPTKPREKNMQDTLENNLRGSAKVPRHHAIAIHLSPWPLHHAIAVHAHVAMTPRKNQERRWRLWVRMSNSRATGALESRTPWGLQVERTLGNDDGHRAPKAAAIQTSTCPI